MEGREDQILYFRCGVIYVHKPICYRVRSIVTSQGQTVWSRKKWSFLKLACQELSACRFWAKSLLEFESEYLSFKWPWPLPLTLDSFLMRYYFSMTLTHWCRNFSNCSENQDFVGNGDLLNDLVLINLDLIVCATPRRDEHTGGRIFQIGL